MLSIMSVLLTSFTEVNTNWDQDVSLLPSFSAILTRPKEAKAMALSLGPHKAMVMRNHGVLTVGSSIESCIYWLTSLERCADLQMRVWGLGKKVKCIQKEKAEALQKMIGSEEAGKRAGRAELEAKGVILLD